MACSGKNTTVQAVASSIGLRVIGSYVGQNISVRSEADELYSELINASITIGEYSYRPYIYIQFHYHNTSY